MKRLLLSALLLPVAFAQSLTGLWDATVVSGGVTVPFRMEFASEGTRVQAWFFNDTDKTPSTSGSFENGALLVNFDHLAAKLQATWKDGRLEGVFLGKGRTGVLKFSAQPAAQKPVVTVSALDISGEWELNQVRSGKGESAWRFLVRQSGPEVAATILRVDGDTGTLAGTYRDGKFVLSHFSGARAAVLEVEPRTDGSLSLTMKPNTHYTAVRPARARAQGLAGPTDPDSHTGVKNPSEPLDRKSVV